MDPQQSDDERAPRGPDPRPVEGGLASPACLMAEWEGAAPRDAAAVAAWRRAERERLLAARAARPVAARDRIDAALARHLDALLRRRLGDLRGRVLSGYWPIRGEPDLRNWLGALREEGVRVALPVVEERGRPLAFRLWTAETGLVRGHWSIPVPPPEAPRVLPEVALAPLVGWDAEGFRLGYGGGYFDRTLAALAPRPLALGLGLQEARLATIHPQPHDIPLDAIVTEAGVQFERPPQA